MKKLLLYTACLLLISCTDDPIPQEPTSSRPVFTATGQNNDRAFLLQAGLEDYYMFSDYRLDENLYTFSSDLDQVNTNRGASLKFELSAAEFSGSNGKIDVLSSVSPGFYKYLDPDFSEEFAALKFISEEKNPAYTYTWDFGDGNSSNEISPVHRYASPGFYKVTLTVDDGNGCVNELMNVVDYFDFSISGMDQCGADFSSKSISSSKVGFGSNFTGADLYYWDFGDGTTSIEQYPEHQYATPGTYKVKHIVYLFADSCVSEYSRNISTNNASGCSANFGIEKVTTGVRNPDVLSKVRVSWMDDLGVEFWSDINFQDEDSYFEIVSVEAFKANEKDQPTYKLELRINCELINKDADYRIRLEDVRATMAIAYPSF